jgi:DNA-binding beta-propeller fold protein YncE
MMRRHPIFGLALAAALCACGGGGGDDDDDGDDQPVTPVAPTEATMIASEGFTNPMDAVASLDGETFYFSAFTDEAAPRPGIFSIPATGGDVKQLAAGAPLENPAGLLLSSDGKKLYIADIGHRAGELGEDAEEIDASVMYTISTDGGALTRLAADGISEAAGIALSYDEDAIYVTGYDAEGRPGLFTLPPGGGTATAVLVGAPLESPSGVYVDQAQVAWVMDQHPSRGRGGALWAIDAQGEASEVVSGLGLSEPAGVSLAAGGRIAVIPHRTADGAGQLLTVDTQTGEQTTVESTMREPAGIRSSRQEPIFAVVDSDGAIYSAK